MTEKTARELFEPLFKALHDTPAAVSLDYLHAVARYFYFCEAMKDAVDHALVLNNMGCHDKECGDMWSVDGIDDLTAQEALERLMKFERTIGRHFALEKAVYAIENLDK